MVSLSSNYSLDLKFPKSWGPKKKYFILIEQIRYESLVFFSSVETIYKVLDNLSQQYFFLINTFFGLSMISSSQKHPVKVYIGYLYITKTIIITH